MTSKLTANATSSGAWFLRKDPMLLPLNLKKKSLHNEATGLVHTIIAYLLRGKML